MESVAHKPGRTLWHNPSTDTYEWHRNHEFTGMPVTPHGCRFESKRQADIAWREANPPGKAGRPKGESPPSDGNPTLQVRFAPEILEQIQARGGAAWARQVLLAALKNGDTNSPGIPDGCQK